MKHTTENSYGGTNHETYNSIHCLSIILCLTADFLREFKVFSRCRRLRYIQAERERYQLRKRGISNWEKQSS